MRVPSLLPLLVLPALGAVACGGRTSTDGPEHCGAVSDQIWARDINPHDVTCDVTVTGDLIIGEGARVRFAPGTSLIVQGNLIVEGTDERPVRFEPAEEGLGWVGVWVRPWDTPEDTSPRPLNYEIISQNPADVTSLHPNLPQGEVDLSGLVISGAGIAAQAGDLTPASLIVERSPVRMDGVTIEDSRSCGLFLGEAGRFATEEGGLTITGSTETDLCMHPAAVTTLPEGFTLGEGGVEVSGGRLTGEHVWRDLGFPYKVEGTVSLDHGTWTLEPGVALQVGPGVAFEIGGAVVDTDYGVAQRGSEGPLERAARAELRVAGTSDARVVIGPDPDQGVGAQWDRIVVDGGGTAVAHAVVEHATISAGGSGVTPDPATFEVRDGATATLTDTTLEAGGGAGLRLAEGGLLVDSRDLTITTHAYPAVVTPEGLLSLPSEGSTYTGNNAPASTGARPSGDVIYVEEGVIDTSGTWRDHGVSYAFDGSLQVRAGVDGSVTDLTIEPGVTASFPPGAELETGSGGPVRVVVGSAAGDPVVFQAPDSQTWEGMVLGPAVLDGSRLENTVIRRGGSGGYALDVVASDVFIDGLTVEDSVDVGIRIRGGFTDDSRGLTVTGSGSYPIWVLPDTAAAIPETDADLTGNGLDYVRVDGNSMASSGTWGPVSVPYYVERQLRVTGTVDTDGGVIPARLTVEPGTRIHFGWLGALRTEGVTGDTGEDHGSVWLLGTEDDPVVLDQYTPDDEGAGARDHWTGLILTNEDDPAIPETSKSRLANVRIRRGGGGDGAPYALIFDNSTPLDVSGVRIEQSRQWAIGLLGTSYVDVRGSEGAPVLCDRFDLSPYTFVDLWTSDGEPADPRVADERGELVPGTDPSCQ